MSRFARLRRRTAMAAVVATTCVGIGIGAENAPAAPDVGIPQSAAGALNIGWDIDVQATCLFSRSLAVTTGQQIDVYLPDALKAHSFNARPWMKIVTAGGARWVTQGWKQVARSDDTGYPIKFSWTVRERQADFYPAIELYFPNERAHTFSVAYTKTAGLLNGGVAEPCHLGG